MKKAFWTGLQKAAGLLVLGLAVFWQLSVTGYGAEADGQTAAGRAEQAVSTELEDGEYSIEVSLEGGSGRSTVLSPAVLVVRQGRAYARIEWSSSNYDYMLVGSEKFLPINEEGNSVFEIPVTVFDTPMEVVGDTTAMSTPHEITYQLTFELDSAAQGGSVGRTVLWGAGVAAVLVLLGGILILGKRRKKER